MKHLRGIKRTKTKTPIKKLVKMRTGEMVKYTIRSNRVKTGERSLY